MGSGTSPCRRLSLHLGWCLTKGFHQPSGLPRYSRAGCNLFNSKIFKHQYEHAPLNLSLYTHSPGFDHPKTTGLGTRIMASADAPAPGFASKWPPRTPAFPSPGPLPRSPQHIDVPHDQSSRQ